MQEHNFDNQFYIPDKVITTCIYNAWRRQTCVIDPSSTVKLTVVKRLIRKSLCYAHVSYLQIDTFNWLILRLAVSRCENLKDNLRVGFFCIKVGGCRNG